jgi:hypothetical protein
LKASIFSSPKKISSPLRKKSIRSP